MPLTASLYVPGTIVEPERVLVELGTGYYAEKSVAEAQALISRKVSMVSKNADNMQETVTHKRNNLETIVMVMRSRLNAPPGQGQGQPQEGE